MEPLRTLPRNLQFRAGLLLGLTLIVAIGFVVFVLFARGAFEKTQQLTLVADTADGVSIGMDLAFSGFPIGRVHRISLADDGRARIEIRVPLEDARWLRASSIFTIERGLVGGARIRAYTGNLQESALPDGATRPALRGDTQEEIPRMVATLRSALENLEQMSAPGGSLQASLANLRAASERLAGRRGALSAVLGSDEDASKVIGAIDRANTLLTSLGNLSRRIDGAVTKADGILLKTDQRLFGRGGVVDGTQRAVGQANEILVGVRDSLKKADQLLADAQQISGNVKTATTDLAPLRAEVEASLRRVSALIEEINRKWPFQRESEIKLP